MNYLQLMPILFICISLIGCDDDDDVTSDQISTNSFVADLHVTNGGGDITAVEAQLRLSTTSSFIDLKDGDKLFSSTVGPVDSINITEDLFANLGQTTDQIKLMTGSFADATFPTTLLNFTDEVSGALYRDNNTNTNFTVSLDRPVGENAPNSNVTLPLGFSIVTPQSAMNFSRSADNIAVSWNTVDDTAAMNVTASLICPGSNTVGFNNTLTTDTGNINIPAGTFVTAGDNCKIRIVLDRFRPGTIDPKFAVGSQIIGHQKRFVEILSVP